jgi:hypothetical protein
MFQDEPTNTYDAIRWHRGLIDFYRINLLRPHVGGNPTLLAGHQVELEMHERRLVELEAEATMHPVGVVVERAQASG